MVMGLLDIFKKKTTLDEIRNAFRFLRAFGGFDGKIPCPVPVMSPLGPSSVVWFNYDVPLRWVSRSGLVVRSSDVNLASEMLLRVG